MLNFILLQAGGSGFNAGSLMMIVGMIAIFYFFMIRPQQKKQKEQRNFINEVKKGDQVVTVGGIHGKVSSVEESTVMLELDKGFKIKLEKSSISLDASKKLIGDKK